MKGILLCCGGAESREGKICFFCLQKSNFCHFCLLSNPDFWHGSTDFPSQNDSEFLVSWMREGQQCLLMHLD